MVSAPGPPGREGAVLRRGERRRRPDEGEEQGRVPAPLPPPVRPRPPGVLERLDRRSTPRRSARPSRPRRPTRRRSASRRSGRPRSTSRTGGTTRCRRSSRSCGDRRGTTQAQVLYWLRFSATRLPVQPYGRTLDDGDAGQQRAVDGRERRASRSGASGRETPPERRAEVVAALERLVRDEPRRGGSGAAARRVKIGLTDTQFGDVLGQPPPARLRREPRPQAARARS